MSHKSIYRVSTSTGATVYPSLSELIKIQIVMIRLCLPTGVETNLQVIVGVWEKTLTISIFTETMVFQRSIRKVSIYSTIPVYKTSVPNILFRKKSTCIRNYLGNGWRKNSCPHIRQQRRLWKFIALIIGYFLKTHFANKLHSPKLYIAFIPI